MDLKNILDAGDETEDLRHAKQTVWHWVTLLAPNGHPEHNHSAKARSLMMKGNVKFSNFCLERMVVKKETTF